MEQSPRNHLKRIAAAAFVIAPFVFATIRILQTHGDYRMLWMAIIATISASLVFVLATRRGLRQRRWPTSVLALGIATSLATITGVLLGAKAVIGVFLVALVLSLFSTIGWMLALA